MGRDFDVVVLGATGVTGRNVAVYLASRAATTGASWAVAGRDLAKVEKVLADSGLAAPAILQADVTDRSSLDAVAQSTRVLLNLVGPYAPTGRAVVAACVAAGAHYADLCGEMQFVRRTIDEFDSAARQAGVTVVQPAGFESVPSDLLVRAVVEAARGRHREPVTRVALEAKLSLLPGIPRPSDTISGGTAGSLIEALRDDDATVAIDPAALLIDTARAAEVRQRSPIRVRPRRSTDGRSVLAPMLPFAFINPAVIHRSSELGDGDDGPFGYTEGTAIPARGPAVLPVFALAGVLAGDMAMVRGMARASAKRRRMYARFLERMLPSSGQGPRPDRLEGYKWSIAVTATTASGSQTSGRVDGTGHIGYLASARMIGEVGLLLAGDPAPTSQFGCLPPAIALGTASMDRFSPAGLTFTID